jgi:hypothetical protein
MQESKVLLNGNKKEQYPSFVSTIVTSLLIRCSNSLAKFAAPKTVSLAKDVLNTLYTSA